MKYKIKIILLLLTLTCHSQNIVVVLANSDPGGKIYLLDEVSGNYKVKSVFSCRFGYKGIKKEKQGDGKTPLGHYKVNDKRIKNVDVKFGGRFIQLDYPNKFDTNAGKSGGNVGIHGGANDNTLGCIRVLDNLGDNNNTVAIKVVFNFVSVGTDVIITDNLPFSIGREGQILSSEVSKKWKNLISTRRKYSEISSGSVSTSTTEPTSNAKYIGIIDDEDGYANIRSGCSVGTRITGQISRNEAFSFQKMSGNWWEVTSKDNIVGYMHSSRVKQLLANPTGKAQINDPDGYTNVRSKENNKIIIGKVYKNETFWYKENSSEYWDVVTKTGMKGVMHKSRIKKL